MSNIKHSQKKNTVNFEFAESFTIEDSNWFSNKCIPLLQKNSIITIAMNNINRIDLSGIQMLLAILQYCKSANKEATIQMNLNDDIKELVKKAGFQHILPIG